MVTIIAIVVIAGAVVLIDHFKKTGSSSTAQLSTSSSTSDTSTQNTTDNSSSTSSGNYKDGTYTATSNYEVPHGEEEIKVNLTISSGTITAVSVANSENDHDSAFYQEEFFAEYKSSVIGKKISGLQISTIAGASDTTQGFNDALNQIASQAQA